MPAGTVKVDVSDVYDWYKLGQHISNMKGLGKHDFGQGPPSTILSFGDEDTEHKYIQDLEKTGLTTTDIDPVDVNQPKGMKRQKTDPTYNVNETEDRKAAVLKIQKHLNKKYGANLDLDGKLGPLTLKSINKFMPRAKTGLADEPNKTTAVQGKKLKEATGNLYTDTKPKLVGLSFSELERLSESAGDDYNKFNRTISENLNLPKYKGSASNTLNLYSVYRKQKIHESTDKKLSDTEKKLFSVFNSRVTSSIDSVKPGDTVSLLMLTTLSIPNDKTFVNLQGFLNPKQIESITNSNGTDYLHFVDGTKFPDTDNNDPMYLAQSWAMTKLFDTYDSASKAYLLYALEGEKLSDEIQFNTNVDIKQDIAEAPRTLQSQVTPLEKLVQDYGYLTTFGMSHLDKQGATPEAQQQLLALVQRLSKDGKTFANLEKQKMEANRDTILNHIHSMMQYAIPVLKKNLPADKWEAKRSQINSVLTAYNNARQINEASGYIPSAKEKNDPRFKTALTVDVKPDAIKKNAKAFGFKTSRAGIPPQARADGKITEALISYTPDKKFVNEKEEIQYVANNIKDWRIRHNIFETIAARNINESTYSYKNIRGRVMKSLGSFSSKNLKIGSKYIPVQINILRDSLLFYDVKGNVPAQEPAKFGTLVELANDEAKIKIDEKLYNYPIHIDSANVMMVTVFLDSAEKYDQFRMMVSLEFDQSLPSMVPTGDLTESLLSEWKSFLAEGEEQEELFPGYDEQHREKRLGNWLAKSWGVQNGKPQTFYHATTKDFDSFNVRGIGASSVLGMTFGVERHGSFFAVDPKFAELFVENPSDGKLKPGARILPVHLSIQSPIDLRDDALSRMLSNEETVEEFKANGIDLRSIYNHFYELERWELFDGPEGGEFVENLQKLGFDGAIINEAIFDTRIASGQVWVAFNPNQVKSVYNRGSFSPDDPRLTKESG
jgi:hypothetical protein